MDKISENLSKLQMSKEKSIPLEKQYNTIDKSIEKITAKVLPPKE